MDPPEERILVPFTTVFNVEKRGDKYYVTADVFGEGRKDSMVFPEAFDTFEEAIKKAKSEAERLKQYDQGFADA